MDFTTTFPSVPSPTALPPVYRAGARPAIDPNQRLKQGIWLYFFLLVFEGALRRWVLPGLATPLLVVRDPLALWLLVATWQRGLLPANPYLSGMVLIGALATVSALLVGHGSLPVAVFGGRILLLHFPLLFIIGRIFNRDDVLKMGRTLVYLVIPMAVLIALQFYSPQSAWVNRGVGGDLAGAGFDGAMGFFRPPGTFSFTNGTHLFFGLAACFIFYFWLYPQTINRLLLLVATAGLLAAIPLSISRSLLLFVAVALVFAASGFLRRPGGVVRLLLLALGLVAALAVLSQISLLQTPIEASVSRFTAASDVEGGLQGSLGDRYLGGMLSALNSAPDQPFFGYGLGMGTNAGSALLMGGSRMFLISEGEWGRLIGEMGPLLGLAVIALRLGLCVQLTVACYRRLTQHDVLPWILLGNGLLMIPQAQWAQPTTLGFCTLVAGLLVASLRQPTAPARALSPTFSEH